VRAISSCTFITYFTVARRKLGAWTITRGTKAPQAAAVIHTDFEKGFIRAEYHRLCRLRCAGGEAGARTAASCGSKARNTSSPTATWMHFRFIPENAVHTWP